MLEKEYASLIRMKLMVESGANAAVRKGCRLGFRYALLTLHLRLRYLQVKASPIWQRIKSLVVFDLK